MSEGCTTTTLTGDAPWYGRIAETVLTRNGLSGLIVVFGMIGVGLTGLKLVPAVYEWIHAQTAATVVQTETLRDVKVSLQKLTESQQQNACATVALQELQKQTLADHRDMMAALSRRN